MKLEDAILRNFVRSFFCFKFATLPPTKGVSFQCWRDIKGQTVNHILCQGSQIFVGALKFVKKSDNRMGGCPQDLVSRLNL